MITITSPRSRSIESRRARVATIGLAETSRVKESFVLVNCIAIRHAGDVVRDDARAMQLVAGAAERRLPLRRQEPDIGEQRVEQLSHHSLRLGHHPMHAMMAIQVLEQEPLEREA